MVQDDTWFECNDGTRLFLRRWQPQNLQPKAILNIAHGMAEHSERYGWFAEKLCGAGIEVWAADQRGHGKTADLGVNGPGRGGLLGHCYDTDTFERVTADIHEINMQIRKTYLGTPLFLMGHSWGSFIAQNYIGQNGSMINGCILSGTRGPGGFKVRAGIPFLSVLAALKGKRKGSPLARAAADGPYNKAFRPNRTAFDWLSRDEAKVDAYCADPLCGKLCSTGFYRDLAKGLHQIHQSETMEKIRKDLPIYIVCGSADPVGDMGASPSALVNTYRSLGIKDLEFALYPGARHEPLNETNREEVAANLLPWIQRHQGRGN
ncbi:MAG: lysophospholipase [Treponema sp.]|nr:lysophospholipase [Treponema sp.]